MILDRVCMSIMALCTLIVSASVAAIVAYAIYTHAFPEPLWTDPAIEHWSEGC